MTIITIARVTIELTSPMAIGSGESDTLYDAHVVTDADGCPTIPGTSIAGVVRHEWANLFGAECTARIFGQAGTDSDDDLGNDSVVSFSFGHIHDSHNKPKQPLLINNIEDPVLLASMAPITRNHVRINEYGVAADKGLYDRDMVPTGNRFTFEVEVRRRINEKREFDTEDVMRKVIGILHSSHTFFGAGTRSGLGRFTIINAGYCTFDLSKKNEYTMYSKLPTALWDHYPYFSPIDLNELSTEESEGRCTLTLNVRPRGAWQIAGGIPTDTDERTDRNNSRKPVDIIPWRESSVVWNEEDKNIRGSMDLDAPQPVVPGTSIKGALRHRVTYHYNTIINSFVDDTTPENITSLNAQRNKAVWDLFGGVIPKKGAEKREMPVAGKLFVEDPEIKDSGPMGIQDHVTIDRFTGGALSGHLFDEAFYWKGEWVIRIHVDDPTNSVSRELRQALEKTIDDLKDGMLQVGAGDARGHGRLQAVSSQWSDNGTWINGQPANDSHPTRQEGQK